MEKCKTLSRAERSKPPNEVLSLRGVLVAGNGKAGIVEPQVHTEGNRLHPLLKHLKGGVREEEREGEGENVHNETAALTHTHQL